MRHYIHQEIVDHLLLIYHKESKVLPEWDVIADVVQLAKMEPTFENIRFATQLYYVLEDLLHPVKHVWITIEAVDEQNKTISVVKHEIFENEVGEKTYPYSVHEPDKMTWNTLYKNKTVEELNNGIKAYPVSKFEWQLVKEESNEIDDSDVIRNWTSTNRIKDNYISAFHPVIDRPHHFRASCCPSSHQARKSFLRRLLTRTCIPGRGLLKTTSTSSPSLCTSMIASRLTISSRRT